MRTVVEKFPLHSRAPIERYDIFSRQVYDKETEKFKTQTPSEWNTDAEALQGKTYLSSDVIESISANLGLYAIWPDVFVNLVYNYFGYFDAEEAKINETVTLKDAPSSVAGFKGWLDKSMRLHLPSTEMLLSSNTQLFLSTCQELSLSYDLAGGYLEEGKQADPQASLYSKWISPDYQTLDTDASVRIAADSPKNRNGSTFGCWKIGALQLHKGDVLSFKEDTVVTAQWLFDPTYHFYESVSFNGTDPGEKYGEIKVVSQSEDPRKLMKRYKAIPADGYQFDFFEVQTFDGHVTSPAERYEATQIEVQITKVPPEETQLNLNASTVAWFSEDWDSWFRIYYRDGSVKTVKKPDNPSTTVTNMMLKTKSDANVVKIVFPTSDVQHVESQIFSGCTSLAEVQIASRLCEISEQMFSGDSSLVSITCAAQPNSLTAIQSNAFASCSKLQRLDSALLASLVSIGASAFQGCSSLDQLEVSPTVNSVGMNAFKGCSSLKSLDYGCSTFAGMDSNALQDSSIETVVLGSLRSTDLL